MPDVLVAGETLVDFLADRPGPLAEVEEFARRAGGAPANVAVALARLDHRPWFWTRVGADPFGDFLAETLAAEGIPDRFVERDPDARTSLAFVSREPDADRGFTFYRDGTADTRMQAGTVPDDALEAVDWVYVGGVPFADEPSRSALFDLVARARERGCTVAFDPNARPELWQDFDFSDTVEEVLAHADLVKATPADLRAAGFEGGPRELARAVADHGPHTVFVTRGEAGAVALATEAAPWGPASSSHEGYDVVPVDTTGAGDAFTAGVIAALVDGETVEETLAFANAVAALATTDAGAMAALPTRSRIEEFQGSRSNESSS